MEHNTFSDITPEILRLAKKSEEAGIIDSELYTRYDVKRGLRDINGKGVLAGLTHISDVRATEIKDGVSVPAHGKLFYRGYNVQDLINGFTKDDRFGFEETVYLLLFSRLPNKTELAEFKTALAKYRTLPDDFVNNSILKNPGRDMMNILSRSVLALYTYDDNPDDTTVANVLRQCLQLAAVFPPLAVYGYQSYRHFHLDKSLVIHRSDPALSTAENLLYLLREDGQYTHLEAKLLDLALVLHAEHGGGNNSTFTTHVVTSSGTDTYSAIAAALGGANIKVVGMFDDMKANIDTRDRGAIEGYLRRLLDKEAYDRAGLIYGMGHAVYSLSDPRADILRDCARVLSVEKGLEAEYELYETVAEIAPRVIAEKRRMYKGVSANVDFYSGLIYRMLALPEELYTPLFAIARIAGWSAHRIEEIQNAGKIIRPAYIGVRPEQAYIPLAMRG